MEDTGFFADSHNSKENTRMSGEKPTSITPLTIRQLLGRKTVSEKFLVDGKELYIVGVLGMVSSINRKNGFTIVQIDDTTGKLDVKVFDEFVNNNQFVKSELEQIQDNTFVKVFGLVSEYKDRLSINAQMIRRVEDANEIYFHMIECIQVHLFNTVGLPEKTSQSNRDVMNTSTVDNSGFNFSSSASASNTASSSAAFSNLQRVMDDITEVARTVVMNGNKRTGVTKADILSPLLDNYSEEDLENAFSSLVNHSILFNTIDEEHFTINTY